MILEFPAQDDYRNRAMRALAEFLRPAEPSGQPTDIMMVNSAAPGE